MLLKILRWVCYPMLTLTVAALAVVTFIQGTGACQQTGEALNCVSPFVAVLANASAGILVMMMVFGFPLVFGGVILLVTDLWRRYAGQKQ